MFDASAIEENLATGSLFKASDHTKRRRFAAPGGAYKREEGTALNGKGDVVDCCVPRKCLGYVLQFEDSRHIRRLRRAPAGRSGTAFAPIGGYDLTIGQRFVTGVRDG